MGQLISNLEDIARKSNAQTVLTSHSTAIIKRIDPENLRYFRLEIDNCVTRVRSITLPDKENSADQYKFIKEAVKAYPELYFADVYKRQTELQAIPLPPVDNLKELEEIAAVIHKANTCLLYTSRVNAADIWRERACTLSVEVSQRFH